MAKRKDLTKQQVLAAMAKTKSNRAASRYLNVSYQHYKKWAKFYKDLDTSKSLFELHINQCGKGIPKFLNNGKKMPALLDIIEGRVDPSSFNPEKIKYRLVEEGYLEEKCYQCGFNERRVFDYKMPLIMNFKDKNKKNYRKENTEFLCYNCYFLFFTDIFSEGDIKQLEEHRPLNSTTDAINFQLDDYQMQRLKELGLYDPPKVDDPYDLVSKI
jgi:transposase